MYAILSLNVFWRLTFMVRSAVLRDWLPCPHCCHRISHPVQLPRCAHLRPFIFAKAGLTKPCLATDEANRSFEINSPDVSRYVFIVPCNFDWITFVASFLTLSGTEFVHSREYVCGDLPHFQKFWNWLSFTLFESDRFNWLLVTLIEGYSRAASKL